MMSKDLESCFLIQVMAGFFHSYTFKILFFHVMYILKHFLHVIKYFEFKFKMPKLKCSSSFRASQAKRRKQLQRQDPAKRQQHLQAQCERHQLAALTTTVSLEQTGSSDIERRRQHDAEAH